MGSVENFLSCFVCCDSSVLAQKSANDIKDRRFNHFHCLRVKFLRQCRSLMKQTLESSDTPDCCQKSSVSQRDPKGGSIPGKASCMGSMIILYACGECGLFVSRDELDACPNCDGVIEQQGVSATSFQLTQGNSRCVE